MPSILWKGGGREEEGREGGGRGNGRGEGGRENGRGEGGRGETAKETRIWGGRSGEEVEERKQGEEELHYKLLPSN